MLSFPCNPIDILMKAFHNVYPTYSASIHFNPDFGKEPGEILGSTYFPDDGGEPVIEVSSNITVHGFIDILAHELAHVVTPVKRKVKPDSKHVHGKKWKDAVDKLNKEYTRLFYDEAYKNGNKGFPEVIEL